MGTSILSNRLAHEGLARFCFPSSDSPVLADAFTTKEKPQRHSHKSVTCEEGPLVLWTFIYFIPC